MYCRIILNISLSVVASATQTSFFCSDAPISRHRTLAALLRERRVGSRIAVAVRTLTVIAIVVIGRSRSYAGTGNRIDTAARNIRRTTWGTLGTRDTFRRIRRRTARRTRSRSGTRIRHIRNTARRSLRRGTPCRRRTLGTRRLFRRRYQGIRRGQSRRICTGTRIVSTGDKTSNRKHT